MVEVGTGYRGVRSWKVVLGGQTEVTQKLCEKWEAEV